MIKKSKVVVRIIYERDGTRRTLHGEIDENKLDGFCAVGESFLCLLNDGVVAWLDKEAILSVCELETKLIAYEKHKMEDASFVVKQGLKI